MKLKARKKREKQTLFKKRLKSATNKYIDKLHHRDMFDLADYLKTCGQSDNEIRQITIISGRKEVMKDQIMIRVLGLSLDDWRHLWSAARHEFTGD